MMLLNPPMTGGFFHGGRTRSMHIWRAHKRHRPYNPPDRQKGSHHGPVQTHATDDGSRGGAGCGPRAGATAHGAAGSPMRFYEKGGVRIHYEETGSGFPLLLIAGGGLNSTISALSNPVQPGRGVQGRVPLHRDGPAQRQRRAVLRPARDRPAVGCLHGRSSRPDGSPGHRQVHGDGLLHRRPVHLEPPAAGAQPCRRGRAGAAQRVPPGDARPLLPEQHHRAGARRWLRSGPTSRWRWSTSS